MENTTEQVKIIDEIVNGEGNLLINAFAGTGKTTTMVEAINETNPELDILCCAFNKSIADELAARMPEWAECKTLHSLGFRAWKQDHPRAKLDMRKHFQILNLLKMRYDDFPGLKGLIGLAKNKGIVPGSLPGSQMLGSSNDAVETWHEMIEDHDIDCGDIEDPANVARSALIYSIDLSYKDIIDFDDMLYLPVITRAQFPQPDLVVVDEAQDMSPIQHIMLQIMTRRGRLVAVGDRHQAIYGFRGADHGSMDWISKAWQCQELTLSQSFRCPIEVVKEAQITVPGIRWWAEAEKGAVEDKDSDWDEKDIPRGSAILCRNNRPIMSLAFSLIRSGRGAVISGRDIGQNLKALAKKVKQTTVGNTHEALYGEMEKQIQVAENLGKRGRVAFLHDKFSVLFLICAQLKPTQPTEALIRKIDGLFSDKDHPDITLSTIHKAKGKEWAHVFFLDRELIPSKWATTPGQLQQENNLAYVAVTRAKKSLTYIHS